MSRRDVASYRDSVFPGGETWRGRVHDSVTDLRYQIEYYGGTVTTFTLEPGGDGGTELVLTDEGVAAEDVIDVEAGWVSVLLALKAAADLRRRSAQSSP